MISGSITKLAVNESISFCLPHVVQCASGMLGGASPQGVVFFSYSPT